MAAVDKISVFNLPMLRPLTRKPNCFIPASSNLLRSPRMCSIPLKKCEDSIDWRSSDILPKVRQQGCATDSCWAVAPVAAIEAKYAIVTGDKIKLSAQELLDCCTNYGLGWSKAAFMYAQLIGLSLEENYRWEEKQGLMCRPKKGPKVRISGFSFVNPKSDYDLMQAVALQPVVVHICAGDQYLNLKKAVYDSYCFQGSDPCKINHAVLCVGYERTLLGGEYWILMNSWGPEFADNGYFYLKKNTLLRRGQCGILSNPIYPEVPFMLP